MRQSAEGKRTAAATNGGRGIAVAETPDALRLQVKAWRSMGHGVALVPTMGALHAGHLALLAEGRALASRTVVSIFVNPTQFSPSEDLARYPRTFDADCALLREAGADLVYAPTSGAMYPPGFSSQVIVGGPANAGLEDAARPHFFGGVATVVFKLLQQTTPDVALFGEKDYQQLRVVSAMTRDLDSQTRIVAVPTVRDADGLALSSRNRFLDAAGRRSATIIPLALNRAAQAIRTGASAEPVLAAERAAIKDAGFALDYLEARHAETLVPLSAAAAGPIRLLVAARIGTVRLIDNIAV